MTIVYSLPVHESVAVIIDTIRNINKYSPENIIIIHVNPEFTEFTAKDISEFSNVFINPNQLTFSWGQSLLAIHNSNFLFAKSLSIEFSYVSLFSSNQMFVAHGFNQHIKNYRAGVQLLPAKTHYCKTLTADPQFREFMQENQLSSIYKGHWEGSFYSTELFQTLMDATEKNYHTGNHELHLEEFIYPMLVNKLCSKKDISSPACYMEIGLHPGLEIVSTKVIDLIRQRSADLSIKGKISASKIDNAKRWLLNNTYIYGSVNQLFMIKRVDRKIDDPIRRYINSLDQNCI